MAHSSSKGASGKAVSVSVSGGGSFVAVAQGGSRSVVSSGCRIGRVSLGDTYVTHQTDDAAGVVVVSGPDGRIFVNGKEIRGGVKRIGVVVEQSDGTKVELPWSDETLHLTIQNAQSVVVSSQNGPVRIDGGSAISKVSTQNGSITVHGGHIGRATSHNGSIITARAGGPRNTSESDDSDE